MKKRKLISLLLVVLLISTMIPIAARASTVTLVALNPLGEIEVQDNLPLTSRERFQDENGNPDFYGKVIGLAWYTKTNNEQVLRAFGELLQEQFPGVIIVDFLSRGVGLPNHNLGSPWNHRSDAVYNVWAGVSPIPGTDIYVDAVIFGVAD